MSLTDSSVGVNADRFSPSAPAPDRRDDLPPATTPVGNILRRLSGVHRTTHGWLARCPAHRDRNPSLSVKQGRDGRALVYCHTGCLLSRVVEALGLTMADLYPQLGFGCRSRDAAVEVYQPEPEPEIVDLRPQMDEFVRAIREEHLVDLAERLDLPRE